jgi:hypothetical protein
MTIARWATVLAAVLAAATATAAAAAEGPAPAAWEEQVRSMLYLIMDFSSINAINGINLTREQALELRALAQKVEAASPPRPDLRAAFRPDLAEVRDTYLELQGALLAGTNVSDPLEKKVAVARGVESLVVRLAGTRSRPDAEGCGRCHGEPEAADVRNLPDVGTVVALDPPARGTTQESFFAHTQGLAGVGGLMALAMLAPQVDALLRPEQRDAFASYACCLIPPKSMSDPARIGQAASGEKGIAYLRWARSVPAERWPAMKALALDLWRKGLVLKSPGLTEAELTRACQRIAEVYEKARSLSEVDFELDKNRLADQLGDTTAPPKTMGDRERKFMAAVFLIGSGTTEAYDRLIQRLDAAPRPTQ